MIEIGTQLKMYRVIQNKENILITSYIKFRNKWFPVKGIIEKLELTTWAITNKEINPRKKSTLINFSVIFRENFVEV